MKDKPDTLRAHALFERAKSSFAAQKVLSALRLAEEAFHLDPGIPGLCELRAKCLAGIGRLDEAWATLTDSSSVRPSRETEDLKATIGKDLKARDAHASAERKWASSLKPEIIAPLEAASHRYAYRGHAMIKNPFDLALYPLLLWNLKPATVFEIGSFNGASALWMADTLTAYGIDSHIWSLDVVKVTAIESARVTFLEGSGRDLAASFPDEMIAECPRPFLVIDDADHTYETSCSVLKHFDPHFRPGDYFVVEDGLTAEGPRRAIAEFIAARHGDYEVDAHYCDFFGYNSTWCVNGFIRRMA